MRSYPTVFLPRYQEPTLHPNLRRGRASLVRRGRRKDADGRRISEKRLKKECVVSGVCGAGDRLWSSDSLRLVDRRCPLLGRLVNGQVNASMLIPPVPPVRLVDPNSCVAARQESIEEVFTRRTGGKGGGLRSGARAHRTRSSNRKTAPSGGASCRAGRDK
jgi:hypothetical protein